MNIRRILTGAVIALFAISAIGISMDGGVIDNASEATPTPEPSALTVPEYSTVIISAAGDVTLATDDSATGSGSFEEAAEENDYDYFFYHVREIFEEDNLTIVNFEGTLSDKGTRVDKEYAFRGKPEYTEILTSGSVEAVNLANNHSSDYGSVSLDDTVDALNDADILNFYGINAVMENVNGIEVGLCGFNALNDTGVEQAPLVVSELKARGADLVIASVHWGIEKDTEPTEDQQELAHEIIDAGADLVLGHHPHVLQGIEKYNGKYIVYSLGNFCFGGNRNPSDKDTMIFRQTFTFEQGVLQDDDNVEIIPCSITSDSSRNNYQPIPAVGEQYERIVEKLTRYTNALGDKAVLNFRAEPEV